MNRRDVVITGIGIASSLGEGVEAHAAALAAGGPPIVETEAFKPYPCLLYTSPSPRDGLLSRMPSSA